MALRYVGKEAREHRTKHPCQRIDHAAALAYLHYAEPQRQHARKAEGYLEGRLGRGKRGVHYFGKHLGVAHHHKPEQGYDEGNHEKCYPNIIQYHIVCKNKIFIRLCKKLCLLIHFFTLFRPSARLFCHMKVSSAPPRSITWITERQLMSAWPERTKSRDICKYFLSCRKRLCKRPCFALQKVAFQRPKGHLSEAKRRSFGKPSVTV